MTIEIRCRKAKGKYTFIVPQCLKMWNEYCSEETLKYVKEQVKEVGEQAVKKYERKIEKKRKINSILPAAGQNQKWFWLFFIV